MANMYRQWSDVIPWSEAHPIAEQKAWVHRVLRPVDDASDEDYGNELEGRGIVLSDVSDLTALMYWPAFECSFVEDGLWVRSEEAGDLEHLAAFVRSYLATFDPSRLICIQWADWCDRLRAGEFGGGVVVIAANVVKWASTRRVADDIVAGRYLA
ncbi:MAG: hypothetical protein HYV09_29300 [Deltaproteobacteria bacterium]|nr:hypothetical protein [Deltaproteobacteria bacterium]